MDQTLDQDRDTIPASKRPADELERQVLKMKESKPTEAAEPVLSAHGCGFESPGSFPENQGARPTSVREVRVPGPESLPHL